MITISNISNGALIIMIENEINSLHHDYDYSNDYNPNDERKKITVYKKNYIITMIIHIMINIC
jgi:hypothetical protein